MTEPDENVDDPLAGPSNEEWIRPTGKRSFVWDHFKENNDRTKFKCEYCNKTFKTTGPVAYHLRKMHYIAHRKKLATDSNQPTIANTLAKNTSLGNLKAPNAMGKIDNEGKKNYVCM